MKHTEHTTKASFFVSPLPFYDASCPRPTCKAYRNPEASTVLCETNAPSGLTLFCPECEARWPSIDAYFSKRFPLLPSFVALITSLLSFFAFPYLRWSPTIKYLAGAVLILASVNAIFQMWRRRNRRKAYLFFSHFVLRPRENSPDEIITKIQEFLSRSPRLPIQVTKDSIQSLLETIKESESLWILLEWATSLPQQARALLDQIEKLPLSLEEKGWLLGKIEILVNIEANKKHWKEFPQEFEDRLQSLLQALKDWPQSSGEEADELAQECTALEKEILQAIEELKQALFPKVIEETEETEETKEAEKGEGNQEAEEG